MTIYRNPAHDLITMRDMINRVFDEAFGRQIDLDESHERVTRLPIDVYSTENEFVVTASVPGISPEDVTITAEGDTLTISGEIPARLDNVDYLYSERFHGKFMRTLQLNVPINLDQIEATFDRGVLTLILPKAEAIKPRQIKVTSKS
jgi:HSP20 family protein